MRRIRSTLTVIIIMIIGIIFVTTRSSIIVVIGAELWRRGRGRSGGSVGAHNSFDTARRCGGHTTERARVPASSATTTGTRISLSTTTATATTTTTEICGATGCGWRGGGAVLSIMNIIRMCIIIIIIMIIIVALCSTSGCTSSRRKGCRCGA